LLKKYPQLKGHLVLQDFLKMDLSGHFKGPFSVIGNFPYNISGQILFKVLEHRNQIPFLVGMFQKEVAERISAPPGTKVYGKLSVLLQAYYDIKILFQVGPQSFSPSPKVRSSVVQMKRNNTVKLDCDEGVFFRLVKQGFSQRRKVLGNSLKSFLLNLRITDDRLKKRPEQLTVKDFVELTRMLQQDRIRT
jgi:16S rRNA (adenine1518-N6/adenine1519-N6)-dimethyltransferase